jgi:hypothetical protein
MCPLPSLTWLVQCCLVLASYCSTCGTELIAILDAWARLGSPHKYGSLLIFGQENLQQLLILCLALTVLLATTGTQCSEDIVILDVME